MRIMAWVVDQYFCRLSTALEGNPHYWNVTATCMALLAVPTEEMQASFAKVAKLSDYTIMVYKTLLIDWEMQFPVLTEMCV